MESAIIPQKRIRESAPFRKSMSMNQEDIDRASELERLFTSRYPEETPFSFSKTISKALEIAYESMTSVQEDHKQEDVSIQTPVIKSRVPKMFRNGRKH